MPWLPTARPMLRCAWCEPDPEVLTAGLRGSPTLVWCIVPKRADGRLGVTLEPTTLTVAATEPGAPAEQAGVPVGSRIVAVQQRPVRDISACAAAIAAAPAAGVTLTLATKEGAVPLNGPLPVGACDTDGAPGGEATRGGGLRLLRRFSAGGGGVHALQAAAGMRRGGGPPLRPAPATQVRSPEPAAVPAGAVHSIRSQAVPSVFREVPSRRPPPPPQVEPGQGLRLLQALCGGPGLRVLRAAHRTRRGAGLDMLLRAAPPGQGVRALAASRRRGLGLAALAAAALRPAPPGVRALAAAAAAAWKRQQPAQPQQQRQPELLTPRRGDSVRLALSRPSEPWGFGVDAAMRLAGVAAGSPAGRAGLGAAVGTAELTHVNGARVTDRAAMRAALQAADAAVQLRFRPLQTGGVGQMQTTTSTAALQRGRVPWGFEVAHADLRIVAVHSGSPADVAGLGDYLGSYRVTHASGKEVATAAQLYAALGQGGTAELRAAPAAPLPLRSPPPGRNSTGSLVSWLRGLAG
eukprot:TRINITY_DN14139_c0_g1_i1.p1 TRINITY_DN14139_c0_g1~~TRINITY_DN14139_c0_g1_i1.p1  ORF type:complete len:552 (+),score=124.56 TRINITY_DN14139_c0_g1_i1:95-1657(+)